MALNYNLRKGYRVAQIDRTRFYVCNDARPEYSSANFPTREIAQAEADRLNGAERST